MTLTPDGEHAVYAATRIDLDDDAYRSDLWIVRTDGSAPPRRLTVGPKDAHPRVSPDGRWLAFLRGDDEQAPHPYVLPLDGGEPRRLAEPALGASSLAWRPDSTAVAYTARVAEPGRYGVSEDGTRDPDAKAGEETPRRITSFRYRIDGVGFYLDRPNQVFVVAIDDVGAEPVALTEGPADHSEPAWSPDGRHLAVVAARHEHAGDDVISDVWMLPAAGGPPRLVTDTTIPVSSPTYSPDGATIWFRSPGHPVPVGRNVGLYSAPADGSAPPTRHTDAEGFTTANPVAGATQPLLVDDHAVVAPNLDRGRVPLLAYPPDGGEPTELVGGERSVGGYARAGDVLVAVCASDTNAGELVAFRDGAELTLTDLGGPLSRSASLRPMVELETTASDGYPVHGWVVKPAGTGPFPVLLCIHGGPFTQYSRSLFDEAQIYAGAGYAVVLGNPRGAAGYGEAHGRAAVGAFGTVDRDDLEALLDHAVEDPDLDAHRVGVLGGSYGGFMTSWLVGHTDRFFAAVSERAVNAWDSFLGASDIGWMFAPSYVSDDPVELRRRSPLYLADRVTTPVLIVHSEQDWRCPVEQAQRYFVALKRAGAQTELLLFPGEGHELSRSGLPSHRVTRFEAILDWFDRHLPAGSRTA